MPTGAAARAAGILGVIVLRKFLAVAGLTGSMLFMAGPAWALDCFNASRPAPDISGVTPIQVPNAPIWIYKTVGNWAYIYIIPEDKFEWTFLPPGTVPAPGANGNYQAGQGFALLDKAQAPCLSNRQTGHGIQSSCGGG